MVSILILYRLKQRVDVKNARKDAFARGLTSAHWVFFATRPFCTASLLHKEIFARRHLCTG